MNQFSFRAHAKHQLGLAERLESRFLFSSPVGTNDTFDTIEDTPIKLAPVGTSLHLLPRDVTLTEADGSFEAYRNYHDGVSVRFEAYGYPVNRENWSLRFAVNRETIVPGTYRNATRFPFENGIGLDVSGNGEGNNTLSGQFTVHDATYNADGSVKSFWADFEQVGTTLPLTGTIKYHYLEPGERSGVLANDSDADDDELTASLVSGPAHGTLAFRADGTFNYTPNSDFNGIDSFTYRVSDGTSAKTAVATLRVAAVNDAPRFTKGADQRISEDAGPQSVNAWATGISSGTGNESAQSMTFVVAGVSDPSLFSVAPMVDASTGRLTYTPAPNAFGTATVTLFLKDGGGTANGGVDASPAYTFRIIVNPVDDPPQPILVGSATALAGVGYLIKLAAVDPDGERPARWTIDWGDGAVEGWSGVTKTAFHTYAKAGTYSVRAWATSSTGKFASNLVTVDVGAFDAGRYLLKDVNPGAGGSSSGELVVAGGLGYFFAESPFYGRELWRTDGTPQGTWMLKDISPGPAGSFPAALTPVGNSLYFRANDGTHGEELWKTDGTPGGTYLVRDASGSGFAGNIVRFGRSVLFGTALNGSLMRSDGTATGTVSVPIDGASGGLSIFDAPVVSGARAFFASGDISQNDKDALWAYDGTSARMVKGGFGNSPRILGGDDKGTVYFQVSSSDLWRSDGTAAGTVRIPLVYGSGSLYRPQNLQVLNGRVFFTAILVDQFIGLNYVTRTGRELWTIDPTGQVTGMVRDINPGATSSDPSRVFSFGGSTYFSADAGGGTGRRLWRTDGTEAGTALAADLGPSDQGDFTPFGDDLLFTASAANGLGLYRMAANGVLSLVKLLAGPDPLHPPTASRFTSYGAFVYFVGPNGEVWQSDGTAGGTRPFTQLAPGPEDASVHELTRLADTLWFTSSTDATGEEVWAIPLKDAVAPPAPGVISGTVFSDNSGDGVKAEGEHGASGFRVFIDRNNDGDWNGGEWQTRTDSRGRYSFADVLPGAYWIRVTPVERWRFTTNERFRVVVRADGAVVRYFGVTRNVLVTGSVFMDANRSGARDSAEDGLAGWRVFVDADGDGMLDGDEISVLTDASGRYTLATLAGGTCQLRVVESDNYRSTTPSAGYHVVSLLPGATAGDVNFGRKRIAGR